MGLAVGAESPLAREALAAHNAVRAKVGVPALAWSDDLATAAQKWANTLIETRQFAHEAKSKFGQNLFEIRGAHATPSEVVEDWAAEAAHFDYKANKCSGGQCGHYTQIVWRKTTEVGCAVAREGPREVWVCEYNPPGNYVGQRPY
jgi:uncharacterized protein YkwD